MVIVRQRRTGQNRVSWRWKCKPGTGHRFNTHRTTGADSRQRTRKAEIYPSGVKILRPILGVIIISDTAQFIVYTLEFCPNCEILKEFLASRGAPYTECDMASAEGLTELRMNGVFVQEAPVLQKGDTFYTSGDLFAGGALREDLVADLIAGA